MAPPNILEKWELSASSPNIAFQERVSQQWSNLLNAYAQAVNKQRKRRGALYDDNFSRSLVADRNYFYNMICYIHHNPVKHGFCTDFRDWWYLQALPKLNAQVVLMDIGLPDRTGIECIQLSRAIQPNMDYLIFTNHLEPEKVFDALAAGAVGYLLKGCLPEQLAQAIREVHAGGSPMSWQISRLVTKRFKRTQEMFPLLEALTPQEIHILQDLAKGKAYKEIHQERYIAENTVRSHVKNIYRKLQIHTRAEAIFYLLKQNAPPCHCPHFDHLLKLFLI